MPSEGSPSSEREGVSATVVTKRSSGYVSPLYTCRPSVSTTACSRRSAALSASPRPGDGSTAVPIGRKRPVLKRSSGAICAHTKRPWTATASADRKPALGRRGDRRRGAGPEAQVEARRADAHAPAEPARGDGGLPVSAATSLGSENDSHGRSPPRSAGATGMTTGHSPREKNNRIEHRAVVRAADGRCAIEQRLPAARTGRARTPPARRCTETGAGARGTGRRPWPPPEAWLRGVRPTRQGRPARALRYTATAPPWHRPRRAPASRARRRGRAAAARRPAREPEVLVLGRAPSCAITDRAPEPPDPARRGGRRAARRGRRPGP